VRCTGTLSMMVSRQSCLSPVIAIVIQLVNRFRQLFQVSEGAKFKY
jgi:hypothetical protein